LHHYTSSLLHDACRFQSTLSILYVRALRGASVVCQLAIKWTVDPTPTTLEHVRIDHRRGDVLMSQEFLHGADIGPFLQQVRGKAMPTLIVTLLIIRR
jgi:hypothetical protein